MTGTILTWAYHVWPDTNVQYIVMYPSQFKLNWFKWCCQYTRTLLSWTGLWLAVKFESQFAIELMVIILKCLGRKRFFGEFNELSFSCHLHSLPSFVHPDFDIMERFHDNSFFRYAYHLHSSLSFRFWHYKEVCW